jgi:hypothetical protein
VASIRGDSQQSDSGNVHTVDIHIDSHADWCVFSEHSTIIYSDLSQTVNFTPFKANLGIVQGIPVSTIGAAYDDTKSFATYILMFHESLQVLGMEHHMLCPNQLRENGIQVNDIPLLYTPVEERNQLTHSIVPSEVVTPLTIHGAHSTFTSRIPTDHELVNPHLFSQIHMTADRVWEPHDDSFQNNEYAIRTSLSYNRYTPYQDRQISEIGAQLASISYTIFFTICLCYCNCGIVAVIRRSIKCSSFIMQVILDSSYKSYRGITESYDLKHKTSSTLR